MYEFVEPQVRRLVAEHLGVGCEELVSEVSLREDLAAASLDLVDLARALEGTFAIEVSDRSIAEVRTYSDLVHLTGALIRAHCEAEERGTRRPPRIWARVVAPVGASNGTLERSGRLTPYLVETIADDAARAGTGTRVEVTIATGSPDDVVQLQRRLAGGGKRGAVVIVKREDGHAVPQFDLPKIQSAVAHSALTDPLLDQLTGARTTVTVTGYAGDDPWQADDLMAGVGHGTKRFADGTPLEKAQALTGDGPCRFIDRDSTVGSFRATTDGHHVHAHFDRRPARGTGHMRECIEAEPPRMDIGPGFARDARYYQSGCCTAVGPTGELLFSRQAAFYAQDVDERAFEIASATSRPAPTESSSGRQRGLRAHFDMSSSSPNGFRPLSATLDCPTEYRAFALIIHVSARIDGTVVLGRVTLHGGVRPTMDVRLLPAGVS